MDLINVVLSRPGDRILYVGVCFNLTYCTTLTRLGIIIHYTEWTGRSLNRVRCLGDDDRRKDFFFFFYYYLLEHTSSFEHGRFRWSEKFARFSRLPRGNDTKKTELQLQTFERTAVIYPPLLQSMRHLTIRKTVFAAYRFYGILHIPEGIHSV